MRTYLLVAESLEVASGLRIAVGFFDIRCRGTELAAIVTTHKGGIPASSLFQELAGKIEPHLVWEPEAGRRLTIVVGSVDLRKLNPLDPSASFHAALAMLILAFPEVHWVFANTVLKETSSLSGQDDDVYFRRCCELLRWHTLATLSRPEFEPLFDPSGLRDLVKENARRTRDDAALLAPFLTTRRELATALDDEMDYAYFNAYAAYRFGFRALPVSRMDLARELWASPIRNPGGFTLSMEDIYAKLPDAENGEHLARLAEGAPHGRHFHLPGLYVLSATGCGTGRVIVSSHHDPLIPGLEEDNRAFCDRHGIRYARKPFKGIFAFWRDIGAVSGLHRGGPHRITATYYRSGFVWPPQDSERETERTGHSPPGRLNLVGSTLLARVRRYWLVGVASTADATRGAVLATLALELFGGRVPTSSVDALLLRHQFEVAAECRFSGVEYNIDVRTRLVELREELRSVFARSPEPHRNVNNAEMLIINGLVLLLIGHAQFDEEQYLRAELLSLHHSLIRGLRSSWNTRRYKIGELVRHLGFSLHLPEAKRRAIRAFEPRKALLPALLRILSHVAFLVVLAPLAGLVWLRDKYVEFVTASPAKLILGAVSWVLALAALLVAGERGFEAPRAAIGGVLRRAARAVDQILGGPQGTAHELAVALVRSFELQTGINLATSGMETWKLLVCAVGTVMGLIHFGLLISMMYTRLTRK